MRRIHLTWVVLTAVASGSCGSSDNSGDNGNLAGTGGAAGQAGDDGGVAGGGGVAGSGGTAGGGGVAGGGGAAGEGSAGAAPTRPDTPFAKKACWSEMPGKHSLIADRTFSIQEYGATPNDDTDDTEAIQEAVDALYAAGGGTLLFPAGKYVIRSVNIKPGIIYEGEGEETILFRPPNQGKWNRTFITRDGTGHDDRPLVIRNMLFDGNAMNQWAENEVMTHALEQAAFIAFFGDLKIPTRIQTFVENVKFLENVGDGVLVGRNTDAHICRVEGNNVFRGTYVHVEGYSSARVYDVYSYGDRGFGGQDVEVGTNGVGYGNSRSVDIEVERMLIVGGTVPGKFDVQLTFESPSVYIGRDIITEKSRLTMVSQNADSEIHISDSSFTNTRPKNANSRILAVSNAIFDHVDFVRYDNINTVLPVMFKTPYVDVSPGAKVQVLNSTFSMGGTSDPDVSAIDGTGSEDHFYLHIENTVAEDGFKNLLGQCTVTCTVVEPNQNHPVPGRRGYLYHDD